MPRPTARASRQAFSSPCRESAERLLADPDRDLVEVSRVPVAVGPTAEHDRGGVRDRADVCGLRERLSVDDELDRGRRLDALNFVPIPVVEAWSVDQLAVACGALEAARRLAGVL